MKYSFKANIFLGVCLFLFACSSQVKPSPAPSSTAPSTQTVTPFPTQTPTLQPTPTIGYPTLLPTIDPKSVPELLRTAITVQTFRGANEHTIQQITGWDYGFRQEPCNSYQWLDSNHLLLYPRSGEGEKPFMDGTRRADLSSEPVVINLTSGYLWLRPSQSISSSEWSCNPVYWSRELGILINQENHGTSSASKEGITTYTFDGQQIARYPGKILDVSPSGTKILVDEDTIIDLRAGKIIDLAMPVPSTLYWSSDETRVYRCCFHYADLGAGKGYNLEWNDLRGGDGKPISFSLMSPHTGGQWIQNNTYFFPTWDHISYGGDPTMIFNPAEKKYDVVELSSVPIVRPETRTYTFSPDAKYVWINGYSDTDGYHGFLVNLNTFESSSYNVPFNDFFWSPDGKFGWMDDLDSANAYVLSAASKKLEPFPVGPKGESVSWHPKGGILAFLTGDDQSLVMLNATDMTVQELKLPVPSGHLVWSPNGDHVVFKATDGSLWQLEYPSFGNVEQLTEPLPGVHDVFWSPDGTSIAFISSSDIYIVETTK